MDPDSRGHYHVPDPSGCNACRELEKSRKAAKSDAGHLYWHVEPDQALQVAMEAGPVREGPLATLLAHLAEAGEPRQDEPSAASEGEQHEPGASQEW